jgi:hypothetical protein
MDDNYRSSLTTKEFLAERKKMGRPCGKLAKDSNNSIFPFPDSFSRSFAPMTLDTKLLYDQFLEALPGALTSPLFFQGLYAWNFTVLNRYVVIDDHLCMVASDLMTHRTYALPPVGALDSPSFERAVDFLYAAFESEGLPLTFNEIPEYMLRFFSSLKNYDVNVSFSVDWSDYSFLREDFMDGINKKSSREAMRQFEKNGRLVVREIAPPDINRTLAVTWKYFCSERLCADCVCGCEATVVSRAMGAFRELGLTGVIVESEGTPIAFCLGCSQKDTFLFFLKKVKHGVRGLNEYINVQMMERFGGNAKYVNYSDDMGNAGLRFYKSRLDKHALMHRYTIDLRRSRISW